MGLSEARMDRPRATSPLLSIQPSDCTMQAKENCKSSPDFDDRVVHIIHIYVYYVIIFWASCKVREK